MAGTPYPTGTYNGRMEADGMGNLLASEGQHAGFPIAFENGSYVFVQPGQPSHNERHHQQFAKSQTPSGEVDSIAGTVDIAMIADPDDPAQAALVNTDSSTNPHHYETQVDDPHYDEGYTKDNGVVSNTRPKLLPDTIAPRVTGHTDALSTPDDLT